MKPTKKAIDLLRDQFLYRGQVGWSATDTCQGTAVLWGQLHIAGLVINKGRGCLGHPFSIELTEKGRKFLTTP